MVGVALTRVAEAAHGGHGGGFVELARFQGGDRGDDLEGAGGGEALKGAVEHRRLRTVEIDPLALGGPIREDIRIKVGPARQGTNGPGAGVHGDDRPLAHRVQCPFRGVLQVEIQGEGEVFAGSGGLVTQHPLHLTGGIHLQLLPPPFAAKGGFVGALHPAAADAVIDAVALGLQPLVFLFRDAAGGAQPMGRQGAVGVVAQHVDGHLGSVEPPGLLPETQHLGGGQGSGELDLEIIGAHAGGITALEGVGGEIEQPGQAIPQPGPLALLHQAGLNRERVGEAIGRQHAAMAIQQATADGMAWNQANAIFIGHHPEFGSVEQLQPGQAGDDGTAEEQHQSHEPGGLPGNSRAASGARKNERGHGGLRG